MGDFEHYGKSEAFGLPIPIESIRPTHPNRRSSASRAQSEAFGLPTQSGGRPSASPASRETNGATKLHRKSLMYCMQIEKRLAFRHTGRYEQSETIFEISPVCKIFSENSKILFVARFHTLPSRPSKSFRPSYPNRRTSASPPQPKAFGLLTPTIGLRPSSPP